MGERGMQRAFWAQVHQVIENAAKTPPEPTVSRAGAELELFLFHPNGELASEAEKRELVNAIGAGVELGASVVETHPGPVNLQEVGFSGWRDQLQTLESNLIRGAKARGLKVGRCGTIPWASTHGVERTNEAKYRLVPDFHDRHRPPWSAQSVNGVFVGEAAVVGLLNAFQFSLEATSGPDAVDKLNRLLAISPVAVALSANARVLDCQNTGWADVRYLAWHLSHDTRTQAERAAGKITRIGLPLGYYDSLEEYFAEICQYPFILNTKPEAALPIGVGLFWRDARIKELEGKLIVEFRPISTQPSLEEDLAVAAFVIGRLLWSQSQREMLPSMATVREHKAQAEKYGLNAPFISDQMGDEAWKEIRRAEEGLQKANLLDKTAQRGLEVLRSRISSRRTPSDDQARDPSADGLMLLVEVGSS